jgi:hypothetical protein
MLHGMLDLRSALEQSIAAAPTADLAWGGWLCDALLRVLPVGAVAQLPAYLALAAGFWLVSRRSALELATADAGMTRALAGSGLLCISLYVALAEKSAVFLYFNF